MATDPASSSHCHSHPLGHTCAWPLAGPCRVALAPRLGELEASFVLCRACSPLPAHFYPHCDQEGDGETLQVRKQPQKVVASPVRGCSHSCDLRAQTHSCVCPRRRREGQKDPRPVAQP